MRAINLTDREKRDAHVAFEPASIDLKIVYVLDEGNPVRSVKVIKNTFRSNWKALRQKAVEAQKDVADLLIEADPEIDFDYMGKISSKTKTIYLNNEDQISYHLRFKETVYDTKGELLRREDYQAPLANITIDDPVVWTNKYIPYRQASQMVAFSKVYQLHHVNGLTYDFLYNMAKTLSDKRAFMLLGAGRNGREPLRFTRGGPPYRAFLYGRTRGDAYSLSMHLSNLELRELA